MYPFCLRCQEMRTQNMVKNRNLKLYFISSALDYVFQSVFLYNTYTVY